MFRCELTKKLSKPGEKPLKVPVQLREKTYLKKDKFGQDVVIGKGFEIVKEMTILAESLAELRKRFK